MSQERFEEAAALMPRLLKVAFLSLPLPSCLTAALHCVCGISLQAMRSVTCQPAAWMSYAAYILLHALLRPSPTHSVLCEPLNMTDAPQVLLHAPFSNEHCNALFSFCLATTWWCMQEVKKSIGPRGVNLHSHFLALCISDPFSSCPSPSPAIPAPLPPPPPSPFGPC